MASGEKPPDTAKAISGHGSSKIQIFAKNKKPQPEGEARNRFKVDSETTSLPLARSSQTCPWIPDPGTLSARRSWQKACHLFHAQHSDQASPVFRAAAQ